METQSVRKINWLAFVNIGLGILSFLSCSPTLFFLILSIAGWKMEFYSPIGQLFGNYLGLLMETGGYIPIIGSLLSLVALIVGLITIIFVKERVRKRIGITGITLGILGVIGNLFTFILESQ